MSEEPISDHRFHPDAEAVRAFFALPQHTREWVLRKVAPQKWSKVTSWADAPQIIERACCVGKSCGNTELELEYARLGDVKVYGYVRTSNGDLYSPAMIDVRDLNAFLNEIVRWPVKEN